MKKLSILLVVLSVFSEIQFCKASRIEKAFVALNAYNYFKAKTLFEKSIKKNYSAASFGLASIYFRQDNPFHSIDSAFVYIKNSESSYGSLPDKRKQSYKKYGFDYLNILELRAKISTGFYQRAINSNSVAGFTDFITSHPWSNELFSATFKRDSIAFQEAIFANTSIVFQHFISAYPNSSFLNEAQLNFDRLQYQEYTQTNEIAAYVLFMEKCPENPFVSKAQDRIYEIETAENTISDYVSFLNKHPENRNIGDAWRKIYQLYMLEFSDQRIDQFKLDFPLYPYKEELEADWSYLQLNLLPFKSEVLFGYMDYTGNVVIPAEYEQLGFFKEGLALAMKNGKYGYIDKGNRVVIPFIYDESTEFEQGRALVSINGLQGMIDRSGAVIFPLAFSDLGIVSEDLVYGLKDSLYGYFDKNYHLVIPYSFSEAYAFNGGIAKVQVVDKQAYIDIKGEFVVRPEFEFIDFFTDSLLTFKLQDTLGLMRKNCQIKVSPVFEEIGQLSLNRALVLKNGSIGYIDGAGEISIPPQYEKFPNYLKRGQFNSNLAIVKFKDKFGVIDQQGKIVLPIQFSEIGDISSLLAFSKGKGWGFMDLTGKVILPPQFDYAESFKNGLAIVEKLTLQGVIDSKGKSIIPIEFTAVYRLSEQLFLVSNGSRQGIYSNKGIELVPMNYQQIQLVGKDLLVLTNANELHYLYLPENRIIKPTKKSD